MLLILPRSTVTAQALEEQNLFLIQNSQETEHALDELKQNFSKVKLAMETKTKVDPTVVYGVFPYHQCDAFRAPVSSVR